ncbi:TPA: (d)CMP kinase [Candidatus Dependentiae bacterium]|nr:MAG: Cytidylate kinase [candidate division TM6 bacterium GW2011_GWF2_36_131]KKQ02694.1 MAG: Cytidylate kinase [candidate division TM6 bacterium GW2011_GWE2_36_25]KKQ19581.1 MAG: Cytidylate kinase [candidate division TM6 bacterium GW2011_GWA2_36_9]HBR71095.1 (d)CMP kinase [Candidatus Dependentiae bacterium]HCU01009.1 (d)CMP kinase [Candidatus Dependentiae bacterium]
MIITIDGPVASGKSTLARLIAEKRGFFYINSGILFRALAYVLTEKCLIPIEQLVTLNHDQILACLDISQLQYHYDHGKESVLYDGENLTWHLKTPEVDHMASLIGTNPDVREILMRIERQLAREHDVVIDGRDTGSVVFPEAELKIYLTASSEVRAKRWQHDQAAKGNKVSLSDALKEINSRDERDKTRLVAPLVKPEGAVLIDDSNKSVSETVSDIIDLFRNNKI